MSERRQVWATLSALLQKLETGLSTPAPASDTETEAIRREVRKLGKAQMKANMLAETQTEQLSAALDDLRAARQEEEQSQAALTTARQTAAQQELLTAVIPALDGIEQALESGEKYLQNQTEDDRKMMAGWLAGLRLVRERLLAVLAKGAVTPIPAVGQKFDPYLHRAVGTTSAGTAAPNTIMAEERRGYRTADGVLRFADVIVYKPAPSQEKSISQKE